MGNIYALVCEDCGFEWKRTIFTSDYDRCPLCGGEAAGEDEEE